MYRRQDERDLELLLNDVLRRLNNIESTISKRTLPPGYITSVDSTTGELKVIRTSDSSEVTIL